MGETSIQWCDFSFNPWVGCSKVSPGCTNCYAESYDKRVGGGVNSDGVKRLRWGKGVERVRTSKANWAKPLKWSREALSAGERRRVFCASLADVFDDAVPAAWRSDLASLVEATPWLDWLLLTKRPENFHLFDVAWDIGPCPRRGDWPRNVWLGVTVENQEQADKRIPLLLAQDAAVRFLSMEPLLGPVDLERWLWTGAPDSAGGRGAGGQALCRRTRGGIEWMIIGGESGAKARPFMLEWARALVRQCRAVGVAPFVKQMGSNPGEYAADGMNSDDLEFVDHHGGDPSEWPEDLRVREFPEVPQ